MNESSLACVTAERLCQNLSIISGWSEGIRDGMASQSIIKTCEEGSEVLPAIRDGRSGWKDTHMMGAAVSMTMSGCFGFTLLRSRFHVHTYDLSVLQSPSLTLKPSNDNGCVYKQKFSTTWHECNDRFHTCYSYILPEFMLYKMPVYSLQYVVS